MLCGFHKIDEKVCFSSIKKSEYTRIFIKHVKAFILRRKKLLYIILGKNLGYSIISGSQRIN